MCAQLCQLLIELIVLTDVDGWYHDQKVLECLESYEDTGDKTKVSRLHVAHSKSTKKDAC